MAMFRLRGHHLLCLLGYRGMGYSAEYVENMTALHQTLRDYPETDIRLVNGPDDLCVKFPDDKPCHCEDANVLQRDAAILRRLGAEIGQTLSWQVLVRRISERMDAEAIPQLCSTCPWLSYGVCEEGVQNLKSGLGLAIVND